MSSVLHQHQHQLRGLPKSKSRDRGQSSRLSSEILERSSGERIDRVHAPPPTLAGKDHFEAREPLCARRGLPPAHQHLELPRSIVLPHHGGGRVDAQLNPLGSARKPTNTCCSGKTSPVFIPRSVEGVTGARATVETLPYSVSSSLGTVGTRGSSSSTAPHRPRLPMSSVKIRRRTREGISTAQCQKSVPEKVARTDATETHHHGSPRAPRSSESRSTPPGVRPRLTATQDA